MPVTPSGRKINISAKRPCKRCGRPTHKSIKKIEERLKEIKGP